MLAWESEHYLDVRAVLFGVHCMSIIDSWADRRKRRRWRNFNRIFSMLIIACLNTFPPSVQMTASLLLLLLLLCYYVWQTSNFRNVSRRKFGLGKTWRPKSYFPVWLLSPRLVCFGRI